ncbi:catechol 1,2-dioxygenase [Acinetobacter indicus]|jgi:catechol 1,2-dioxygenase|uniref:Catechol 1,2-dioxygenase n=2 Tax=Acinetobacter lwoffii TaxID=28090 RepID=N9HEE5_ACILW|nr:MULTISPECIES: catechol 1,2-dioxygenase [Acinetobacter]ENW30215.1 catechol 1,2-dioxygenase [Acinetobacter lwoffii NIPH 478]MCJ8512640.1 catechol 1,2-dioxygenase [Acinetobacter lwoffii]MDP1372301.1 catechol 1,2-dioxygenase [Acinetobacter lwoffii]MDP1391691.1 catechol 1,2-dioxygenase [Acinetobacter lwoffii]MDP1449374.1 catechol 1,2-dioxygenase [Acinetobacter lwoffii]
MERKQISDLVKQMNVDTATGPVDTRVQEIIVRLVTDLFQAIDELDIQPSEVWKGLEYLTDAGQANELGLLAAGLGLEHFLDLRADEIDLEAGITGGTPRTIEGPLYVAGAPESVGFARMDDGSESNQIDTLIIEGTVTDTEGNLIENAKVEIWHANSLGNYSFFDKAQSDFNLRRTIFADDKGKYVALTTMPVGYGCPPEGTTQALLNKLGRHGNRPSHVHYFVSAPGFRKLTTQFNIEGDQYLWDDFAFATRDGLVATAVEVTDPSEIKRYGVDRPFKHITFNISLVKNSVSAPSAEVERRRLCA